MKIICASDSFKGSLSSERASYLLSAAAKEVFEEVTCITVPVADGGEGTVGVITSACSGRLISHTVHGPLMDLVDAEYGALDEKTAIVEMASASGLPLVPEDKRNPLYTTTLGSGELVMHLLEEGFTDISIAIGGSATNDGGMGFARALGIRFTDADGRELEGRGIDLERVSHVDMSGLTKLAKNAKFTVMCDVTSPLCGPDGATRTFGAQKGGTPEILDRLEEGMCNYRDVIKRELGVDADSVPGSGAAGGLGAALKVYLDAELRPGIDTVFELIDFDELIKGADLIVTGEGRTDWQSARGKVLQGVGCHAKAASIPAVAISGSLGAGYEDIYSHGIDAVMTIIDSPMSLDEAMDRAEDLYYSAAVRMFRLIKSAGRISG